MVIEGTGLPDRYGVVGYPVAHSLSPYIHTRFAIQTGEAVVYERVEATPAAFADTVRDFLRGRGRGLNVTQPHKHAAVGLCTRLATRAQRAGAVNTLTLARDGGLDGDNTDGTGLVHDLCDNLGFDLGGTRILIAGAGGAAGGVIGPLLDCRPAAIVIANRTLDRAQALAGQFAPETTLRASGYDALRGQHFDLILNATSAGLQDDRPPLPDEVAAGAFCYDMLYAHGDTPFTTWARRHGARGACTGWGMLVEQAAESFLIWRGVRPQTGPVLELLRHAAAQRLR